MVSSAPGPQPNAIASRDVQAALSSVLESEPFRDAPQMRAFLSYVVSETLAGRCHTLKGYTIATMALGRPADFDPQIDPIVRVQAGRVRQALNEYYETESDAPIVIRLDKGSYTPTFERRDAGPAASSELPVSELPASAQPKRLKMAKTAALVAALLAVSVMLAWLVAWPSQGMKPEHLDTRSSMPQLIVEGDVGNSRAETLAFVVRVRGAIARFDDIVSVQEGDFKPELTKAPSSLPPSRRLALRIGFLSAGEGKMRIVARLLDAATQRQVWSREYDPVAFDAQGDEGRTKTVQSIATTLAQPYGVIQAHVRASILQGSAKSDVYGCLVEAFDYWLTNDAPSHRNARDCLLAHVTASPLASAAHAQLAYLHLEEYRAGYNPLPGDPRSRALESARAAVRTAPASARARQALLAVHFARREMDEAWRAAGDAMDLNPYDADILADVGARHVQTGNYEVGLRMLQDALDINPSPPTWATAFRAIALYMLGRLDEAAPLSRSLEGSTYPPAMFAMVLAANYSRDFAACRSHYARLRDHHAYIVGDLEGYMNRLNFDPAMISKIMSSFNAAAGCAAAP
jgi:Tfp pilus assembly protein PilF